nr:putative internal virion protein [uncultured Mediterranean phage uvMED]
MVTIKTISKCFKEIKRLTGDLLSDDQVNQILDEAKIKLNENAFQQQQGKTDKILAQEIINNFEYEQALKKRNLAENNIKALDTYQKIIDAVDMSEGRMNAVEGVEAILVGIQKFSKITRDSIGAKQDTIEVVEVNRLITEINKLGDNAWRDFSEGQMDIEIMQEMVGITTGVKQAKDIAMILKKYQNSWRNRLNDLGANIGLLDDWITRTTHNTEKMANASKISKIIGDNRTAWVEFIKGRLDIPRTFANVSDPAQIDNILGDIYNSIMSGDHLKHGGTNSVYGTRNVTNRLNASRVLHFKDVQARQEYNVAFGEPSLKESVMGVLSNSARNIAIMQELGTNPKDTLNKILALLRKKYKDQDSKITRQLNLKTFENQFKEIDGSINGIGNQTLATISMGVRTLQNTGKLGLATITSFGDLAQYMGTTSFQGRGLFSGLFEALNGLFKTNDRAAMEVLQTTSNSIHSFMGNKYGAANDTWGTMGKIQNTFFKWNTLNGWISSLKSSMAVGLSRHYGMQTELKFSDLSIRERNFLTLYGIDDGKWNMLRSIKTLDVEGKRYMTAEGVNELSDSVINAYVGKKLSQREIRNFKQDLEITWRNVLVDQTMHGTPEPDAAVRAITNQGLEKGTPMGETIRFVMQFKSFPISIWKKIIGRELYSYGPDDSRLAKVSGLASLLMLSTFWGYIAMSVKDMIKGRSPRDPNKKSTLVQAFAQGGGAGIYGDFLINELQNEYGNGIFETALGPTASDIKKIFDIVQSMNDPKKAGKKFVQLAEGNVPFLNLYYTKTAYDYLIGYQVKEYLDPGFFRRMRDKHEQQRGQSYYLKP